MTINIPPGLTPFFKPQGIVLIGASANPVKLGYGLARNLVQNHYPGAVHFVNPGGGFLFQRPVYPDLAQVPDPVDLAILLIPAGAVPAALEACGRRGVKAAIIGSGGFRETGAEGAALEEHCVQIAQQYAIRLLGPNCIGLLDTHLPLDATFLPPPGPPPGDVAFLSHSGAICAAVIDWARGQGFGLSRLISLGNQADVCETDLLAPVAADPYTRVLALYLEGVRSGRAFVEAAGQVTPHKPIIALKVGRFAGGRRAVASHTGALAGEEHAFNAAFRRAGVIRAETSEEVFDWARALAWCPLPVGRAVAILTNAGGPGVTAADALEAHGMRLAELAGETRRALQALLPPAASLHNPVDMLASATPEQYAASLGILLADPGVDGSLVILPPPPMHTAGAVARALIPVIHQATKPVVIALMGERLIQEAVEHLRAARVPEYRFPERAASALAILADRAEFLARPRLALPECCDVDRHAAARLLAGFQDGNMPAPQVAQLLAAYGIRSAPCEVAASAQAAVDLAQQFGYPVALKVVSPDIQHKSDVGGVLLNVKNDAAVARGYAAIVRNVRLARPHAQINGIQVQRMLTEGQEVILGAVRDPQFGPLMMFGSGGVEVEGLKDVAFALAPLTGEEVEHLLASTWGGRRLNGYRHIPEADRLAVTEALQRLSLLVNDFPELSEIEINPLKVMPGQGGVFAVDVRARLERPSGGPGSAGSVNIRD